MHKLIACLWLVVIGSNVAQYYSDEVAYQGIIVFVGGLYFISIYRLHLIRLLNCRLYFLFVLVLTVPILLMLLSTQEFDRGEYTSLVTVAVIFFVSSLLAVKGDFDSVIIGSALMVVLVSVSLNLYELFVESNVWSISPGRSAGLFINPNISSEALIAFTSIFLLWRRAGGGYLSYMVIVFAAVGVLSTFSRAGILISLLLFAYVFINKSGWKLTPGVLSAVFVGVSLIYVFVNIVVLNIDLSEDAAMRIQSLLVSGGVGDYYSDRGYAATASLELALRDPMMGAGVRTIYRMIEGPHNMFMAMLVDYGILGLAVYIIMMLGIAVAIFRANSDDRLLLVVFLGWLLFFSFASHNLLGNASTMVFFGFVMARMCRANVMRQLY